MEGVKLNKVCSQCKRSLPMKIEYFHRRASAKDGFNTRCKECRGSKFGIIHPNRVLEKPNGHKYCTKCLELKPFDGFDKSPKEKDGYTQMCKDCKHIYYKDNFEHFSKKSKEYQRKNKDKRRKYHADYYKENREKVSKEQKKYYEEHKQFILKKRHKYYFDNKERIQVYKKEYGEKNREILAFKAKKRYYLNHKENLQRHRTYRLKNDDKIKAYRKTEHAKEIMKIHKQRRKSRKNNLPCRFGVKEWANCKEYFDNKCAYCGKVKPLEQEHFIPLSKGGEYTINNIIPACRHCNTSKHKNSFFEWYPKQKFYSKRREQKILTYLNYSDNRTQQLALL